MHRVYLEKSHWKTNELTLPDGESRHLALVLRAEIGDEVSVFDGAGRTARASIVELDPVRLQVIEEEAKEHDGSSGITLIQALPKGKRMDLIVEKATELGVSAIIPVVTERVIVAPKADRVERWRRIVVSAAKQCGLNSMPRVHDICSYERALEYCGGFDLILIGSLEDNARALKDVLRETRAQNIGIIIGPEGDLTSDEYSAARSAGAVSVSFGDLVLRVETAALYVMSAVNYECFGKDLSPDAGK